MVRVDWCGASHALDVSHAGGHPAIISFRVSVSPLRRA